MIFARNVVILGEVGSGKRTLGNHIVGGDIFQREPASDTNGTHYGVLRRGGTFYRMFTVDTGSLQTGYKNPVPYIQQKLQEVHSIIFAISHDRNTDESRGSLMHTVESLHQQAKSVSALIITHCERMTDEQREAFIAEFRDNARSSQVVAFMQRGIHAVGFSDPSTLPPDKNPILQNAIDGDEEAIRKLVERCKVPLSSKSLQGLGIPQSHSVTATVQGQATDKKPRSVTLPKYQQQRTVGKTVLARKTSANGTFQLKTPGQGIPGIRQPYHSPLATGALQRQAMTKKSYSVPSPKQQLRTIAAVPEPKTPLKVGLDVSQSKTPVHEDVASQSKTPDQGSPLPKAPEKQLQTERTVNRRSLNKKPASPMQPEVSSQIVRKRCVVLMGKSGAGKSTVANQIVGHDPLSPYNPPFGVSTKVLASVTREVKHEDVEFTREGTRYRVRVIDTVGLFDTSIEGQDPIFDEIERYFKDYIDGINLILFVFKKNRFTAEEQEVFSFIRGKFDAEITPISALAVTGCENDTTDIREKLIQEFKANEKTKEIASQMTMGIHPVGFPPLKTSLPELQPIYKQQMEKDREALRDLIIEAAEPHLTEKLFVEKVKKCTIL